MKWWLLLLLLVPSLAIPCGTPCNKMGVPGIITLEGICEQISQTCKINSFSVGSESSTSAVTFYGDVSCTCGEAAPCNITIQNSQTKIYPLLSTDLTAGHTINSGSSPPLHLEYGKNNVTLACFCSSTNASCSKTTTDMIINATIQQVASDSPISPGHIYNTSMQVRNLGNIRSNYKVIDKIYGVSYCGGQLNESINFTPQTKYAQLEPVGSEGQISTLAFTRNFTCSYQGAFTHLVEFCDENVGCPKFNTTNGCFEGRQCHDYAGSFDATQDCALCLGNPAVTYTCSVYHCCSVYKNWQNGVCCELGQICCTNNTQCPQGFRCDTAVNYCVSRGGVGFVCSGPDDCALNLHCDANQTITNQGYGYCTYNSTTQAGLLDATCWDEDLPPDGCDGCARSSDCISGYFCAQGYALCRNCPSEQPQDYLCDGAPSTNCFGTDSDCCDEDANCTGLGANYFCDRDGKVCRVCEPRQDYWCPSSLCYGTDPDCCVTGSACPSGTVCDASGSCAPQTGGECNSPVDCGVGNMGCKYSSCQKRKACMIPKFIRTLPSLLPRPLNVGRVLPIQIIAVNPQGCPMRMKLSFSGSGKYFAHFTGKVTEYIVTLNPAEVKVIPASFSAGNIGTYTLIVTGSDYDNPDLQDTSSLDIHIIGTGSRDTSSMVVAPEIGLVQVLLILGAAALLIRK